MYEIIQNPAKTCRNMQKYPVLPPSTHLSQHADNDARQMDGSKSNHYTCNYKLTVDTWFLNAIKERLNTSGTYSKFRA